MPNAVQIGNGWYNPAKHTYTSYDPATGQLVTRQMMIKGAGYQGSLNEDQIQQLQSGGDISPYLQQTASNYLGGRSNVNLSSQIGLLFREINTAYPLMSKDAALKYANQWVADRIAMGWDANEIEDFAKGAFRDDKVLGEEMKKGVMAMIAKDEYNAMSGDATGADMADDGGKGSIQDELRAFGASMMQTVGPDSPQAKRIAELAAAAGNKYATGSGVGPGGITTRGVASTAARAHTDLQTQREGLGLQAIAAAGNQQLSVDQLKTQLQQQNQQAGVLNASGIGGLIGSGVGLVGGLVASAYGGGAALPGLVAAGGAGGQAIGGLTQNGSSPTVQYGGGQSGGSNYTGRNWGTS